MFLALVRYKGHILLIFTSSQDSGVYLSFRGENEKLFQEAC